MKILQRYFKKIFLQLFLWLGLMVVIMAPVAWFSYTYPVYSQNLQLIISQNKIFFTIFRWLVIIAFFCVWPRFIRWYSRYSHWKPEKTIFWLNQRLKITLWLVIVELLICENLPLTLIHLLEGH